METNILFRSAENNLEGLLCRVPGDHGVIVAHPHPQYGGDMYNSVVEAVCRVAVSQGYSSLRFNFRGVGISEGIHGGGVDERQDVLGAVDFLRNSGINKILLVGYSFGAYVIAGMSDTDFQGERIFIAPPVGFMDFNFPEMVADVQAVVAAERDDFAPVDLINSYIKRWTVAEVHWIKEADHFFSGQQQELSSILSKLLPSVE